MTVCVLSRMTVIMDYLFKLVKIKKKNKHWIPAFAGMTEAHIFRVTLTKLRV